MVCYIDSRPMAVGSLVVSDCRVLIRNYHRGLSGRRSYGGKVWFDGGGVFPPDFGVV